tara:strand:+ start:1283 stop:4591 length:3309 start_codon:yes stop_codon:yes gene_type:complete
MASFFKKIVKTANTISNVRSVTNAVRTGNVGTVASTVLDVALSQRNINAQLNSISGFGGSLTSSRLGAGTSQLGGILDIASGLTGGRFDNILSGALELEGLINSPIRVVDRSAAEIFNAAGGRFDVIRQQVSNLSELNVYDSFIKNIDSNLSPPINNSGAAASRIPNPLRTFSSYNYKITMGILSNKEYNNPETYRSLGFEQYIIRSAGGDLGRRTQTDQEATSPQPGHAEYFIDNFVYDGVVAPNPKTGVTLGTSFSFTVTEPYSMGNFIESLVVAAKTTNGGKGYDSYFTAPFCLRLDFVGFKDIDESADAIDPIFLPFLITNMDMRVDGKGSVYECSGVAFNEIALSDHMNQLYTQVHTSGAFAHTVLQTGDKSLTAGLNKRVEKLEDAEILPGYDRFIICFPKSSDAIQRYLETGLQRPEDPSAAQTFIEQIGSKETAEEFAARDPDARFNRQSETTDQTEIAANTSMFETLLAFAEDESEMNEIGLSQLLQDASQGGNHEAPSLNGAIQADAVDEQDPDANNPNADSQLAKANSDDPCGGEEITPGLPDKGSAAMTSAEFARTYEFNKSEAITTCIEKVLLNSEFCKENAVKEGEENGLRTWFRIDSQLFLEENAETEENMGRPPYVIVYCIIPYKVVEAKFLKGNLTPKNIAGLKRVAAKEYNYLYTGNNEDVLNFDINFNTAFMRTAGANFGNSQGGDSTGVANQLVASNPGDQSAAVLNIQEGEKNESDEAKSGTKELGQTNTADGNRTADIRKAVAEVFHDSLINSPSDLITVDIEIWGDPFFLPQEIGNYHPASSGESPNSTSDGTMKYTTGEVLVDVNFRTPFDYQDGGSQMEMPLLVPQFSGLYTVIAVSSNFSKGQFTQTLSLVRQPGQDKTKITKNTLGGYDLVPNLFGYQSTKIPDASKKLPFQELSESASTIQAGVNQALNLFENAKNSGKGLGIDIGSLATQAQSAVQNLTTGSNGLPNLQLTAGNTASKAANLFNPEGAFDANAFKASIPEVKIPGAIGSGSFGQDLSLGLTNAIASAVPSLGTVEVDFKSIEGQLAIIGSNLQSDFGSALGEKEIPDILDKTEELKTQVVSVAENIITPSGVA